MYKKYFKRIFDVLGAIFFIIIFSWLYAIIAIMVRLKMGSPVIFRQVRPGKIDPETQKESLFYAYKFRTMQDRRDDKKELLPDEMRLTSFGKFLRASSLDEIPQIFNILKGEMSFIGPRPHLVKDMVFMTDRERVRQTVTPGLSGLAQVNGRNAIHWEEKFKYDLEYVKNISFCGDMAIVFKTIKVILTHQGINENGAETHEYLGDYLLRTKRISQQEYDTKLLEAKELIRKFEITAK